MLTWLRNQSTSFNLELIISTGSNLVDKSLNLQANNFIFEILWFKNPSTCSLDYYLYFKKNWGLNCHCLFVFSSIWACRTNMPRWCEHCAYLFPFFFDMWFSFQCVYFTCSVRCPISTCLTGPLYLLTLPLHLHSENQTRRRRRRSRGAMAISSLQARYLSAAAFCMVFFFCG